MTRWMKTWAAFAALVFLLALPLAAQQTNSATRGGLGGVVYDKSGAVMPGISVKISGPQGDYMAKSDSSGRYEVNGLVPGLYTVVIEAPGFKKFVSERNQVYIDHTSNLDAHLEVGATTDTVQVDAGAVQIDTESTSLNAPISEELYQSLPVARNVAAIFSLAPSVVSGGGTGTANPSIGGATGLENLYLVDGVTITDQAFGGLGTYNRYFGSLGTGVNLAFIKEVDVKTGAFEPKYGRADGGIVEIVTKTGGNRYHGALAAYLGPGSWYADRTQLYQFGYVNTFQPFYLSNPQYDAVAELGGPVPGFKGKMFFFGALDPTLTQDIAHAPPDNPKAFAHGPYAYSSTTLSWAAKLTYQPYDNVQLEASTFGDPTHHNLIPGHTFLGGLRAYSPESVLARYNYGSRDSVARVSTSITPTWIAMGVFTYNFNHFDETPGHDNYNISDRTGASTLNYYLGGYEPTKNDDYSINLETEKRFHFFGEHAVSFGYTYDHTNFLDQPKRTGPLFPIPGVNAAGTDMTTLYGSHAGAIGQKTNATFYLRTADASCTYCAIYNGNPVYLQSIRGTYKGLSVSASSRYHVGWVNDAYQMNRYLTINAGLRWEEQWYAGTLMKYLFNDNWSPRVGFNWDPWGNQKSKVMFNYARYQLVLPLDAAIRQLGNEQDDTNLYFTPDKNADGTAKVDLVGAPVVVPDGAHLLNGLPGKSSAASFGRPNFASSTGEGIMPGTKMEYENEYVLGIQRAIGHGNVVEVRYSDRRLGRVVEDIGSQSPEGSNIDNFYNGGIANVNAKTDISVNEAEVTYTPAQWAAANPGAATPGQATAASYVAPVAGCTFGNDAMVANGDFFYDYSGKPYNGACITNLDTAAGGNPDGKPDGFVNPVRRYQELVFIYTRNLTNHWQGRANYRYAKLWGNYEGLFRNDNGQSDPGISSLFDFTAGAINLLGDQFKPGFLNTDRRNVFNFDIAYTVGRDTRGLAFLNKMTTGLNVRAAAGNPLSAYASHPIYQNTGEVPIGGRGTKGNLPATYQFDGHLDYPVQFQERYTLKLTFDAFNFLNTQRMTGKTQNLDRSPGVPSPDYGKPNGFQGPFYARASIRLEF